MDSKLLTHSRKVNQTERGRQQPLEHKNKIAQHKGGHIHSERNAHFSYRNKTVGQKPNEMSPSYVDDNRKAGRHYPLHSNQSLENKNLFCDSDECFGGRVLGYSHMLTALQNYGSNNAMKKTVHLGEVFSDSQISAPSRFLPHNNTQNGGPTLCSNHYAHLGFGLGDGSKNMARQLSTCSLVFPTSNINHISIPPLQLNDKGSTTRNCDGLSPPKNNGHTQAMTADRDDQVCWDKFKHPQLWLPKVAVGSSRNKKNTLLSTSWTTLTGTDWRSDQRRRRKNGLSNMGLWFRERASTQANVNNNGNNNKMGKGFSDEQTKPQAGRSIFTKNGESMKCSARIGDQGVTLPMPPLGTKATEVRQVRQKENPANRTQNALRSITENGQANTVSTKQQTSFVDQNNKKLTLPLTADSGKRGSHSPKPQIPCFAKGEIPRLASPQQINEHTVGVTNEKSLKNGIPVISKTLPLKRTENGQNHMPGSVLEELKPIHASLVLNGQGGVKTGALEQLKLPIPEVKSTPSSVSTNRDVQPPKSRTPYSPQAALALFGEHLTSYECLEINEYSSIWYVGPQVDKIHGIQGTTLNDGYDDENGGYIKVMHDHLAYRFEILETLGKGSFGRVVRAIDHRSGDAVAVKIIRNKKRFHQQAQVEVAVLEDLKKADANFQHNVVHIREHFVFRNHLCIVFDLLGQNLYDILRKNDFRGFTLHSLRKVAVKILECLCLLKKKGIIHCDLKPENILTGYNNSSELKVIDFGSSCYVHKRIYTYIQSRFYRAPEIILGVPYGPPIDMWSFGCILPELYTGRPLFPGENENEQLACMMEGIGAPPNSLLDRASRRKVFFDSKGCPRHLTNSRGQKRLPGGRTLDEMVKTMDTKFIDLINRCLSWNPEERLTPEGALNHEWMRRGTVRRKPEPGRSHTTQNITTPPENETKRKKTMV
ncbi:unnamed protein product [Calicophoron daubneyi]|uniref:dual-specificity kinase n=1 Tax=Calicophoron daubneyi TaxID=300641 RepID=A0AAV2SXQ0_CALDB